MAMTPSRRRAVANQTVFEYKHTLTRGDVRVLLGEHGYDGSEENVVAFVQAYYAVFESARHATEEGTIGGLSGMTIRQMIDDGKLPMTKQSEWLYVSDERPTRDK